MIEVSIATAFIVVFACGFGWGVILGSYVTSGA